MHLTLLFYTSDSLWGCAFQCLLASWKPPHNSPACPIFLFSICRSYFKSRVVVQPLTYVQLLVTTWTAVHQASWSCTISLSLPRFMPIESVMLSNHLILCCPLLLLPSIFPSIRVFSNELALRIMWPKYWSVSFSIIPSDEYSGLISFRIDWFDLLAA